jgi:LysR family glycine cleavage system transcriptional activator
MSDCPLNSIRAFVAVARSGSIKVAASQLHVTPGAVSRHVKVLEEYLGLELFERRFRSVTLTDAGALYFARVAPALATIEGAGDGIVGVRHRSVVRVDCIPTFAMHWLLARLSEFHQMHQDIEVAISTATGPVDRSSGCDVAVRRDPEHFRGLPAKELMPELIAPVASPHLRGIAELRTPKGLAEHKLIYIRVRPDLWPKWFAFAGLEERWFKRRLVVHETWFAIQAAIEGLGVGIVPLAFVERALTAGQLIIPFKTRPCVSGAYYAVPLDHGQASRKARDSFLTWLARTVARDGAVPPTRQAR